MSQQRKVDSLSAVEQHRIKLDEAALKKRVAFEKKQKELEQQAKEEQRIQKLQQSQQASLKQSTKPSAITGKATTADRPPSKSLKQIISLSDFQSQPVSKNSPRDGSESNAFQENEQGIDDDGDVFEDYSRDNAKGSQNGQKNLANAKKQTTTTTTTMTTKTTTTTATRAQTAAPFGRTKPTTVTAIEDGMNADDDMDVLSAQEQYLISFEIQEQMKRIKASKEAKMQEAKKQNMLSKQQIIEKMLTGDDPSVLPPLPHARGAASAKPGTMRAATATTANANANRARISENNRIEKPANETSQSAHSRIPLQRPNQAIVVDDYENEINDFNNIRSSANEKRQNDCARSGSQKHLSDDEKEEEEDDDDAEALRKHDEMVKSKIQQANRSVRDAIFADEIIAGDSLVKNASKRNEPSSQQDLLRESKRILESSKVNERFPISNYSLSKSNSNMSTTPNPHEQRRQTNQNPSQTYNNASSSQVTGEVSHLNKSTKKNRSSSYYNHDNQDQELINKNEGEDIDDEGANRQDSKEEDIEDGAAADQLEDEDELEETQFEEIPTAAIQRKNESNVINQSSNLHSSHLTNQSRKAPLAASTRDSQYGSLKASGRIITNKNSNLMKDDDDDQHRQSSNLSNVAGEEYEEQDGRENDDEDDDGYEEVEMDSDRKVNAVEEHTTLKQPYFQTFGARDQSVLDELQKSVTAASQVSKANNSNNSQMKNSNNNNNNSRVSSGSNNPSSVLFEENTRFAKLRNHGSGNNQLGQNTASFQNSLLELKQQVKEVKNRLEMMTTQNANSIPSNNQLKNSSSSTTRNEQSRVQSNINKSSIRNKVPLYVNDHTYNKNENDEDGNRSFDEHDDDDGLRESSANENHSGDEPSFYKKFHDAYEKTSQISSSQVEEDASYGNSNNKGDSSENQEEEEDEDARQMYKQKKEQLWGEYKIPTPVPIASLSGQEISLQRSSKQQQQQQLNQTKKRKTWGDTQQETQQQQQQLKQNTLKQQSPKGSARSTNNNNNKSSHDYWRTSNNKEDDSREDENKQFDVDDSHVNRGVAHSKNTLPSATQQVGQRKEDKSSQNKGYNISDHDNNEDDEAENEFLPYSNNNNNNGDDYFGKRDRAMAARSSYNRAKGDSGNTYSNGNEMEMEREQEDDNDDDGYQDYYSRQNKNNNYYDDENDQMENDDDDGENNYYNQRGNYGKQNQRNNDDDQEEDDDDDDQNGQEDYDGQEEENNNDYGDGEGYEDQENEGNEDDDGSSLLDQQEITESRYEEEDLLEIGGYPPTFSAKNLTKKIAEMNAQNQKNNMKSTPSVEQTESHSQSLPKRAVNKWPTQQTKEQSNNNGISSSRLSTKERLPSISNANNTSGGQLIEKGSAVAGEKGKKKENSGSSGVAKDDVDEQQQQQQTKKGQVAMTIDFSEETDELAKKKRNFEARRLKKIQEFEANKQRKLLEIQQKYPTDEPLISPAVAANLALEKEKKHAQNKLPAINNNNNNSVESSALTNISKSPAPPFIKKQSGAATNPTANEDRYQPIQQQQQQPAHHSNNNNNRSEFSEKPSMMSAMDQSPAVTKPRVAFQKASNKQLISQAITKVCLAGPASKEREVALKKIKESPCEHFIVLFKGINGRQDFKALYTMDSTSMEIKKLYGLNTAPPALEHSMIATYFRYDSGSKEFKELLVKNFSNQVDAVLLKK